MGDGESDPFQLYDEFSINKKIAGLSEAQRSAFWRLYTWDQKALDRSWISTRQDLLSLFRVASSDLSMKINDTFAGLDIDTWDLATMRRTGRQQALLRQIADRIYELGGDVNKVTETALMQEFRRKYAWGTYGAESMGIPGEMIRFGQIPDRDILAMLHQDFQGADFSVRIGLITDQMAHDVQMSLTRSMIEMESWGAAARRIRDLMGVRGQAAVSRAECIARTELRRASSLGGWQWRQENPELVDKTVWFAHAGACQECKDRDGEELEGPDEYPPNESHPNCTCGHMDLPKNTIYLEYGQVAKVPQPFEEWAAEHGAIGLGVGGTD